MIYTFYSYKGGVGRSMALANVAEWLYLQGLRVVMIDWDLEAPGLESYFFAEQEQLELAQSQLGLIDILTMYQRQFAHLPLPVQADVPATAGLTAAENYTVQLLNTLAENLMPLSSALYPIHPPARLTGNLADQTGAALWLLSAGMRSGERFATYAQAVQSFDWASFYGQYQGEAYFDWLRRELLKVADVVLIDSRTGVTEMGGVCTRQLADVVVSFCVPNLQNLAGAERMARSFTRSEIVERRQRRLDMVIVPTRIDVSELDHRNRFEQEFRQRLDEFMPAEFRSAQTNFWELAIQYVPKYAYTEQLAINAVSRASELETAYRKLALHLGLLARGEKHQTIWAKLEPELYSLFGDRLPTVEINNRLEEAFALLPPAEQARAQQMLLRLVRLAPPDEGGRNTRKRVARSEFAEQPLLEKLAGMRLVALAHDPQNAELTVQLVSEDAVQRWERLQRWINDDHEYLLWRQFLGANLTAWERGAQDPSLLLRGAALDTATAWQTSRPADLNEKEHDYLNTSRQEAEQLAAEQQRLADEKARLADEHERLAAAQTQLHREQAAVAASATVPAPVTKRRWLSTGVLIGMALVVLTIGTLLFWQISRIGQQGGLSDPPATKISEAQFYQLQAAANLQSGKDATNNGDEKSAEKSFRSAIENADEAIKLQPALTEALLVRAQAAQALKEYPAATADYQAALQHNPALPEAYLNLGNIAASQQNPAPAINYFTQALQYKPDSAEALNQRGLVYAQQKQPDQALNDFNAAIKLNEKAGSEAVKLNVNAGEPYFNRAQVWQSKGDKAAAIADYRKSLELPLAPNQDQLARRTLKELGTVAVPQITPQVFFQFQNQDDADRYGKLIAAGLGKKFKFQGTQIVPNTKTAGDVRFFFDEDKQNAEALRQAVQATLRKADLKLTVKLLDRVGLFKNATRGKLEIWLPALAAYAPKPPEASPKQNAPYAQENKAPRKKSLL